MPITWNSNKTNCNCNCLFQTREFLLYANTPEILKKVFPLLDFCSWWKLTHTCGGCSWFSIWIRVGRNRILVVNQWWYKRRHTRSRFHFILLLFLLTKIFIVCYKYTQTDRIWQSSRKRATNNKRKKNYSIIYSVIHRQLAYSSKTKMSR